MYCNRCGNKINKNDKFCNSCGIKIDEKNLLVVEKTVNNKTDISLIIGIISIVCTFLCAFFSLPLSIIGLIIGICTKDKKSNVGIILNIISLIISIILLVLFILISIGIFKSITEYNYDYDDDINYVEENDFDYSYHEENKDFLLGEWECTSDIDTLKIAFYDDDKFLLVNNLSTEEGYYSISYSNKKIDIENKNLVVWYNLSLADIENESISKEFEYGKYVGFQNESKIKLINDLNDEYICQKEIEKNN